MKRFWQNIGDTRQIEYTDGDDGEYEKKQHPIERGDKRFDRFGGDEFHI